MRHEKGLVHMNENAWTILASTIHQMKPSTIFVIVDENTELHCLSYFSKKFKSISKFSVVRIQSGENHKTIAACLFVWEELSRMGADRDSLIVNLGGGVVTDLGGFVAATFKRGLSFINIPTSLLAMVDASIGGKNGVDLGHVKNQIGVIQLPEMVLIDTIFLETLPNPQLISGMAEMIKHGLIKGETSWKQIKSMDPTHKEEFTKLIWKSIEIKNGVVLEDPLEKGRRKVLNFGHTLGHAIESHFLNHKHKTPLLHGEAIAIGIILASYISSKMLGLAEEKLSEISKHILTLFPKHEFTPNDIGHIQNLTLYDKKNRNGKVLFVLMEDFGIFSIDCIVDNLLVTSAFEYYKSL